MQEKIVNYGTEHEVTVIKSNNIIIAVHAEKINEGFLLVGHGMGKFIPTVGDKGKIVFEKDARKGHWQYYPLEKTAK